MVQCTRICPMMQLVQFCLRWLDSKHRLVYRKTSWLVLVIFLQTVNACYVFPPGKTNPCVDKKCWFGAYCVSSTDGLTGRCQCAERCYNFGDSEGSKPLCGTDDNDYANYCELKRSACKDMITIKIKHYGRCSKYSAVYFIFQTFSYTNRILRKFILVHYSYINITEILYKLFDCFEVD